MYVHAHTKKGEYKNLSINYICAIAMNDNK